VPVELEIEKLVHGGKGLARAGGRVALIPFVVPGEKVAAKLTEGRSGTLEGEEPEILTPSTDRVQPPCAVFGRCGGCQWQHLSYPIQLEWKRKILVETLARIAKINWDGPIETVSGEPWGYRNRSQLRLVREKGRIRTGFFEGGSHRFVAAEQCPINSPAVNRAHAALEAMAGERRFPSFLREIEIFTNETEIQLNVVEAAKPLAKWFFEWCREKIEGFHEAQHLEYASGGDLFRVGGRSFFQVNRFLTDELTRRVIGQAEGSTVLDLYCGVGLFTLPLARRFEQVTGVDSSRLATRSLQFNAERAGVSARTVNLDVDVYLAGLEEAPDLVVADPPRSGLGTKVTAELARVKPAALTLVSCEPATLARDLKALVAAGFEIREICLVDLFPQTFHMETVVRLSWAS
jgi:23S rRNA (uracil1939-C5)-methyltransferase